MKRAGFFLCFMSVASACQPRTSQPAPASAADVSAQPEAAAAAAAPAPAEAPELGSFGIDLATRKLSVKPGDDFYAHAGGAWLDSYQLKPDEMRYGSFVALQYRVENQLKAIIDELSQQEWPKGSDEQRIVDYFASFMDVAALNARGIDPLKPELEAIEAIRTRADLIAAFARAELMGTSAPIEAQVAIDQKDPTRHVLAVVHSGLGLPDRAYYLEESFQAQRAAYSENIAKLLGLSGMGDKQAQAAAKKVLALETEIAKHHWPRAELRDRDKTYNPYPLKRLESELGAYPFRQHFEAAGIEPDALATVIVVTPSAIQPLAKLVKQTPLSTWKLYLKHHLLKNHAPLLGDAIDNAAFEFYGKVLAGQQEQRDRWKRAIGLIGGDLMDDGLGDAIGRLYVAKHFPVESKRQMDALVANLRAALRERLVELVWMGEQTKKDALAKLESFRPKIGYPSKWRDLSGIDIEPGELLANHRAVRRYWYQDNIARLGRPTDRDEWFMTPYAINAYYNPQFNEVVFPAGILQPPFFDPHADPAVNYGGIGAVIGHEMGHGFDDQGSKSDAKGVKRDWWTDEDRARFEERTAKLAAQYNEYEPIEGHKLNGQLTLGENIGDLGGINMALHAYRMSLAGKPAPVLEGLTGEQRFFLAWAQIWRGKTRDALQLRLLKVDPHSPNPLRVNGVVRNMDAWYAAFGVEPGDALYLPAAERIRIW